VNLVGTFLGKASGKTKQIKKNGDFYANPTVFDKLDFGFWCNSKKNNRA